jgi:hypothetical protein
VVEVAEMQAGFKLLGQAFKAESAFFTVAAGARVGAFANMVAGSSRTFDVKMLVQASLGDQFFENGLAGGGAADISEADKKHFGFWILGHTKRFFLF